ncbi:MAG TPA: GAF domain-containing sensor histidine kinase [Anaerolineaceae bacterium]|nr:GAF domain-containing sensor histidine kinase [Anaerolineaceae bacterium]
MTQTSVDYTRRLELLLEVCRSLSANLDLEEFLQAIIKAATSLTASETSTILVLDKDTVSLRFTAMQSEDAEALRSQTIPINQSIAGIVFNTGQPLVINHVDGDKRPYWPVERLVSKKVRSLIEVPMIFKGKTVGVLTSVNKLDGAEFCDEDKTILATLAAQAAVAFENHRLLEESRHAYQQVIELDRMKSDFIAIASHELRTPLGVILGHATFLQDGANPEQAADLDIIVKSSMRLKEIIEEFANVDHFEHGLSRLHRGTVVINQVAQEVANSFHELSIERNVTLDIQGSKAALTIDGDAAKIAMALREVVKNALTFTNPGGQVRILVDKVPGFVRLAVIDTGIGIPTNELAKIFQRFYQVEKHLTRRHGGMGLGLSIARDMVEMHGGKITVESLEGKGSRFTLLLPVVQNQAKQPEKVFIT